VAVQVGLPAYPVTVKAAGAASEACRGVLTTVPEVQVRETVTLAGLSGTKSFFTTNWPLRRVLVIVHSCALSVAAHVPVES
jgi:hypothetical protein